MFKNHKIFLLIWLTAIIVTSTLLTAKAIEIHPPIAVRAAVFNPPALDMTLYSNAKFAYRFLNISFTHPVSDLTLSLNGITPGFNDIVNMNNTNSKPIKIARVERGERYSIIVTSDLRQAINFPNGTYYGNITADYINSDSKQPENITAPVNLNLTAAAAPSTAEQPNPIEPPTGSNSVPIPYNITLGYENGTRASIGNVTYKIGFNATAGKIVSGELLNNTFDKNKNNTLLDNNNTIVFNATEITKDQSKIANVTLNLSNFSIEKDPLPVAYVEVIINGTTQSSTIQLPRLDGLISEVIASSIPLTTTIIDKAEKVVDLVGKGIDVGEKGFNLISGIYNQTISCLNIEVNNASRSNPLNPTFDVEMENCSAHPELINLTVTVLTPEVNVTYYTCKGKFEIGEKDNSQCEIALLIPHNTSNVTFVIRGDILINEIGSIDSRIQEVTYSPSPAVNATSTPPPPPPRGPVANAGPDQIVNEGTKNVTLYGINSLDSDGSITNHLWKQIGSNSSPSNSSVINNTITNTNTNTPNLKFDAPNVPSDTLLTFELTVTDNKNSPDSDVVNVLIKDNQSRAGDINTPPETNGSGNNTTDRINNTDDGTLDNVNPPPVKENLSSIHMVFAIDSSGSMDDNDPEKLRLGLTTPFIDGLNRSRDNTAALISWDTNVDSFFGLTSNFTALENKINEVDSEGGTNLDVGLEAAINVLDVVSNDNNSYKTIMLLSDGRGDYTPPDDPDSPVNDARNKGYTIFTIGLNVESPSDYENTLKNIANITGGQYFLLSSEEDFDNIVSFISRLLNHFQDPESN